MDEQIEQIARAIAETVAEGDDIDIQEALENHFDWITPEQAKRMIDAAAIAAHSVMAGTIAELQGALATTIERVEYASGMFHNSQQWHSEDAPDDSGNLWDWVFAPARAALAPPRHD